MDNLKLKKMNTKATDLSRGKRIFIFLALICSMLYVSCDKNEMAVPSSAAIIEKTAPSTDVNQSTERPWPVAVINHLSGRALSMPDYEVRLLSNRTVIFEGRRNVRFIGRFQFMIDGATYVKVTSLFDRANFFAMKDNVPPMLDVPEVFTTYTIKSEEADAEQVQWKSRTLKDIGYMPKDLVTLRTNVEKVLGIEKYINSKNTDSESALSWTK